jgi:hypothetical protein
MEPDVSARFERVESVLNELADVAPQQDQKLSRLADLVTSLAKPASQRRNTGNPLARKPEKVDPRFERINKDFEEFRLLQKKTDEHLALLAKMMDEWIRRNPPYGKQ